MADGDAFLDGANVGELRRAIERLPDEARIAVEWGAHPLGTVTEAFEQASDAVPPPVGTDPMYESTVGVLVLVVEGVGRKRSTTPVWVVSERIDHHGSEVCGVFSTPEAAEAHAADHEPTDYHEITEWIVDSATP